MTPHFFSLHDYDDVEAQVWNLDVDVVASFDRTGLITWSWFNSAPSHFCSEGSQQTFVEFLERGAAPGVALQPNTQEAMRAHLLARRAGTSTFITLAGDDTKRMWSWSVDGIAVGPSSVAGPAYAGGGLFAGAEGHPPTLLVTPGPHRVEVNVSGERRAYDVVIARGEQRTILLA